MLKLFSLGLAAAVAVASAGTFVEMSKKARAALEPNKWSLVMTVKVGDRYDDYIVDHDLSIGDCYDLMGKATKYFDSPSPDLQVSITYACERR